MLESTFLHLPGMTVRMERTLWENGIRSWQDFIDCYYKGMLPVPVLADWLHIVRQSVLQLERGNILFFAKNLSASEHWRLYGAFRNQAVFLDIETSGLEYKDHITVVGLYYNSNYEAFVDRQNLGQVLEVLKGFSVLVTFNGNDFDIPFLRKVFPGIQLPPVHLDARALLKRLGVKGGQKAIEEKIGLVRKENIRRMSGSDAAMLWEAFLRGEQSALQLLLEYNKEDVTKLKELMEFSYRRLCQNLGWWYY